MTETDAPDESDGKIEGESRELWGRICGRTGLGGLETTMARDVIFDRNYNSPT